MKKVFIATALALSLTSCAELASFANALQSSNTMPSYEFYEKFSETNNAKVVLPILEKHLTVVSIDGQNEQVFLFSPSLVNQSTFGWFTPNDDYSFNNRVSYLQETKNNKIEYISFGFSHVLSLSKSNFYQIFNLNPNDVSISQLKQHCSAYRRIVPLYKLSIKNGKSLYLAEDMGSGSANSSTNLIMFNSKPACKRLGFDKTVKEYGNENFEQ
ncbi:hypothetical protein [Actinobacillus minor]|uniref:hypothetical protein n=1 Tax=Actinobacillus minor TaxID=51047 RepID=UPI0023F3F58D|nr:hypothetical protein [Actinobacillus minor]MDD6909916.1 hypothetical protein [Actinobacillus minor]MDY4714292.1 hypothetical protein [Actinobacillus minor]